MLKENTQPIDVLLVEDSPTDAFLAGQALCDSSLFRILHVERLSEALAALSQSNISVVLLDLGLPDSQGLETLAALRRHAPDVPVIILTGRDDEELAVCTAREGAQEFLVKNQLQEGNLRRTIRHVLERDRSDKALKESEQQLRTIINTSPQCIMVVDPKGTILKMNPAGLRLVEAESPATVIGHSVFSFVAAEFRDAYHALHEVVCRGQTGHLEFEIIGQRGARRSVETVAAPLSDRDGSTSLLAITRDVTERRRAEAELRRTTELLRAVTDGTSDSVFVKDLQGRYLFINPAGAKLVGKSIEDVLGRDDLAIFDADGAQRVMALDRQIMDAGQVQTDEMELTASGITRTFMATKAAYRDGKGKVIGLIGVSRDISERKQLEAERDQVTARLRLQFERMPLACVLFDADLRVTDWNPAAERVFGYRKEEILGMGPPYEKILPPGAWPNGREILRRVREGDMSAHSVNENVTHDGRVITCEWHNTPLFDDSGKFQGMLALARDITRRHEAEMALELRDRAIQAISQGILIADAKLPHRPIIYASPGFERLTGYTPGEVLGKSSLFLRGPETDHDVVAKVVAALEKGDSCNAELLHYRRDGTSFWCEMRISPIRDTSGALTHFVGVHADVTMRRELEDQLRQSQKMEAVGQLAGGVAHDFNNLLTVIMGSCEILQMNKSLMASDPSTVDDIAQAAEQAASLTRQLLAFGRKQHLKPMVVNVNDIIRKIHKMMLRLISEDIELTCELYPAIWAARLDPGQIEQVIVNLVVNARDSMPKGGSLAIETANVEWAAEDHRSFPGRSPGRYVRIVVTDTGAGMAPQIKARIFEPFFTTKAADQGTGLGLAVVHGIVKQSDGYIDVISEPGVGTSMMLHFPAVTEKLSPLVPGNGRRSAKGGSETILLVEDEERVRRLAKSALEKHGYTVLETSNGQRAIDAVERHAGPIEMIVTDVVMPVMGGRQLVDRLLRSLPNLKVLFVTGYADDSPPRASAMSDSHAFLQKPFAPSDLLRKVRLLLDAGDHAQTSLGG